MTSRPRPRLRSGPGSTRVERTPGRSSPTKACFEMAALSCQKQVLTRILDSMRTRQERLLQQLVRIERRLAELAVQASAVAAVKPGPRRSLPGPGARRPGSPDSTDPVMSSGEVDEWTY